jgi:hypothetical protein
MKIEKETSMRTVRFISVHLTDADIRKLSNELFKCSQAFTSNYAFAKACPTLNRIYDEVAL